MVGRLSIQRNSLDIVRQTVCLISLASIFSFVFADSAHCYEGKPILLPPMQAKLDLRNLNNSDSQSFKQSQLKDTSSNLLPNQKLAIEYLRHGAKLHSKGHHLIAESFFNKASKLDPNNADAYFNLGALYEAKGDYVTAKSHYERGLVVSPQDKELIEAISFLDSRLENQNYGNTYSSSREAGLNKKPFSLKSSLNELGTNTTQPVSNPPVLTVGQQMPKVKKSLMGPKTKAVLGTLLRVGINVGIRAAIGGGGCGGGFRF